MIGKKYLISTVCGLLILFFSVPGSVVAQDYPKKPITVIIPFGAGGSHDLNARIFTSIIPQYLGQPMVVKLMPGASGQKATSVAVKAKPDGYTLIFTHNFIDQLQPHTENLPYDTTKSLVTVAQVNDSAPLLWIKADKPWKTLDEMLEFGRKNPGKLKFANSGKWGASFTAGAMILTKAKVQAKFLPYKGGGPSKRAVLAGDGDFTFGRPSTIMSNFKAGEVRILAVGGKKRMKELPDIPTLAEMGYGTENVMRRVLMAPRGISQDKLAILQTAFSKMQEDKTYKRLMKQLGENRNFINGPDYEKIREQQSDLYKKLVKELTGT